MYFNPIPADAPEWHTNKAHYITSRTTSTTIGRSTTTSRFYIFTIGRSRKNYEYMDKYMDNGAMAMLEQTRENKQRVALKGYQSPTTRTPTTFNVLTHIGVYMKDRAGLQVYSPETGETGYYMLKTR